ncbi:uncharacterized protein F4822DRAFT_416659 [Hypoxylon trugodes]|uniref:uncharacterized protein n=1 Tax=Hypoxylon trugodes TaxID=326681 RepID=UPI0021A1721F|nr:uncharacterized protein F4822DRAFT_416659 [Hypoxylon trugodes]KAI1384907.1 hypothetical protein F4822DRAFT_416659 [Hypoxylon trugodes]
MSTMEIDSRSSTPGTTETNKNSDGVDGGINKTDNKPTDAELDPIVASYDIYTNPQLPENRKLLVLEHPNLQGTIRMPYKRISEVRVKDRSGFLEVDVPMSHGHAAYDREKGLRWGSALARSVAAKNGGTHGLAGGFGVGVPTRGAAGGAGRGGAKRPDDLEREISMLDWSEAVRQDKVLRTQTLGGQFSPEKETNCRWMVGVFKGDQLHLTPATSLIHLRPQMHHLDAWTEQERLSRPREAAAGPSSGAAGAASKEGATGDNAKPQGSTSAAKAIHMSIKSAGSGNGEASVDTMVERLRKVQIEPWSKLKYEDEYSEKAWSMFSNSLVYSGARKAVNPSAAPEDAKGKGKANGEHKEEEGNVAMEDIAPQKYTAQWGEDEFLKAVSGLSDNQQGDGILQDDEVEIKAEVQNQAPIEAAKKPGPVRGRGKAAATTSTPGPSATSTAKRAAGPGARGKSVAFKE